MIWNPAYPSTVPPAQSFAVYPVPRGAFSKSPRQVASGGGGMVLARRTPGRATKTRLDAMNDNLGIGLNSFRRRGRSPADANGFRNGWTAPQCASLRWVW